MSGGSVAERIPSGSFLTFTSLSTLPSDVVRVVHRYTSVVRGQLMYQIQVSQQKVMGRDLRQPHFSFENDLFVIYRFDICAFSIYRGGIFHKNVPFKQIICKIQVSDGQIYACYVFGPGNFGRKIAVFTSDGFFNSEYILQKPSQLARLCHYRLCSEGGGCGGAKGAEGGENNKGTDSLRGTSYFLVAWFRGNVVFCQCYDTQGILLSSFQRENHGKTFPWRVWINANATFVCWEGDVLKTYDRFGALIRSVRTDLLIYYHTSAYFSMIDGDCHKIEVDRNAANLRCVVTISNQHGSRHHQFSPYHMSLCLTTGSCAQYTFNAGVLTFDCFY